MNETDRHQETEIAGHEQGSNKGSNSRSTDNDILLNALTNLQPRPSSSYSTMLEEALLNSKPAPVHKTKRKRKPLRQRWAWVAVTLIGLVLLIPLLLLVRQEETATVEVPLSSILPPDTVALAIPIDRIMWMASEFSVNDLVDISAHFERARTEATPYPAGSVPTPLSDMIDLTALPPDETITITRRIVTGARIVRISASTQSSHDNQPGPANVVILALDPQDAVILTHLIESGTPLQFEVRSP